VLLSDRIHTDLRDRILSGELAPGAPVPSERRLSEQLGASRHAVREALKRLQEAGLIRISQRATPAQRAEIAARAEALAATADPEGRNAEYERLWAVIVDAAGNLAYRLALNTLETGQHVLVLDAERIGRELADGPAIRDLAAAIAAGDDERARTTAAELLERSA
jgi:GntR family transcriptional repressor for pyruvate dehydrogenase complex